MSPTSKSSKTRPFQPGLSHPNALPARHPQRSSSYPQSSRSSASVCSPRRGARRYAVPHGGRGDPPHVAERRVLVGHDAPRAATCGSSSASSTSLTGPHGHARRREPRTSSSVARAEERPQDASSASRCSARASKSANRGSSASSGASAAAQPEPELLLGAGHGDPAVRGPERLEGHDRRVRGLRPRRSVNVLARRRPRAT